MKSRAIIAIGLIASALLLAIIALGNGVTLTAGKPYLERRLSEVLGRKLEFGEAPRLQLGMSSRLDITQLRIHDAPWTGNPYLLSVDRARVEIRTWSLLRGPLLIESLELHDSELKLIQGENGETNFPAITPSKTASQKPDSSVENGPPVLLKRALISNVSITRENRKNGQLAAFSVEALSQSLNSADTMVISGSGELQGRPWRLALEGTPLIGILEKEPLLATYTGSIDSLELKGRYFIPGTAPLENLELELEAVGVLPAEIANLSPLLTAGAPMSLDLSLSDRDPGLAVNAKAVLEELSLNFQGSIARPSLGDGIELSLALGARSLAKLAAALGLGQGPDTPLDVSLRLQRDGSTIALDQLAIQAGGHRITGRAEFPSFPTTDQASLELFATGPDVGLYQRLLGRQIPLVAPYEIHASLENTTPESERLNAEFEIGQATGQIDGTLGSFPSYKNSEVRATVKGPSLRALGPYLGSRLPEIPFDATASVSVSGEGVVTVGSTKIDAGELSARASGVLGSYPALDNIDFSMSIATDSLATSSRHFFEKNLQDAALKAEAHFVGELRDLAIDQLSVLGDGLSIVGEGGRLTLHADDNGGSNTAIHGDLALNARIERLNSFLADFGNPALPDSPLAFSLRTAIDETALRVAITDLESPGLNGAAALELNRDVSFDSESHLEADLSITDLRALLPSLQSYEPPPNTLNLVARRLANPDRDYEITLSADDKTLANLGIAQSSDSQSLDITLSAEGSDVRALGTVDGLPQTAQSFVVDSLIELDGEQLQAKLKNLTLGEARASGDIRYSSTASQLTAQLVVHNADFRPWIASDDSPASPTESTAEESTAEEDGRLIPAIALPLEPLLTTNTDINIELHDLMIPDPIFPELSLVTEAVVGLKSGEGSGTLNVNGMRGSRGQLSATALVTARDEAINTQLRAAVDSAPFGMLSRGSSYDVLPKHSAQIDLSATGTDTRQLAASLTGRLLLTGGQGSLRRTALNFATESFAAQLIKLIFPTLESQAPTMEVECTVLALRADQGVIGLDPGFVFRSKKLDLSARGTIDLKQERLAVRFDNQARRGLGISAASLVNPYVQITGTMSKPSLALNLTNTALMGGAAIASGGLTVLAKPLYGRFIRNKDPCAAAVARWNEEQ
ncbi:MAG: AsmA family protein [Pseudomonadota bacterium]